ncbi:MAG TPA: hypothetical protein VKU60_02650 [Chloroflexota bacterium]|nr:hypothetical protein [Chloroflexota bacterium]
MAISVLLSGAENDDDVLRTAACFAAREGCMLKVVLSTTFPKGTFLRRLDATLWRLAEQGLDAPRVVVERQRKRPQLRDETHSA